MDTPRRTLPSPPRGKRQPMSLDAVGATGPQHDVSGGVVRRDVHRIGAVELSRGAESDVPDGQASDAGGHGLGSYSRRPVRENERGAEGAVHPSPPSELPYRG